MSIYAGAHFVDDEVVRMEATVVTKHSSGPDPKPYIRFHIGDITLYLTPKQLRQLAEVAASAMDECRNLEMDLADEAMIALDKEESRVGGIA